MASLRTLKLKGDVDAAVVQWSAKHALLPSLSTLGRESWPKDAGTRVATSLLSLPPLRELSLGGRFNRENFRTILDHHGATLQLLLISRVLCNVGKLRELKEGCPLLEYLAFTMARTEGDLQEVQLYKELGTFPRLQYLRLIMDTSIDVGEGPGGVEVAFDPVSQHLIFKEAFMRQALRNCAVDATLAAAIFHRITAHHANTKPTTPLRHVALFVTRAGIMVSRGIDLNRRYRNHVYRHFKRQWNCDRSMRDDESGEVVVRESKMSQAGLKVFHRNHFPGEIPQLGGLEMAFRALWPKQTGEDWRDDWSSFPLHEC